MNFIKNCETKQDERNVLPLEIGHIAFLIEMKNIKVDKEFIENYNKLMSIEFNGEKFFRESGKLLSCSRKKSTKSFTS